MPPRIAYTKRSLTNFYSLFIVKSHVGRKREMHKVRFKAQKKKGRFEPGKS